MQKGKWSLRVDLEGLLVGKLGEIRDQLTSLRGSRRCPRETRIALRMG